MRLDIKALTIAAGLLWGLAMLLTGIANMLWPGYGQEFLNTMASLYPGYDATSVDQYSVVSRPHHVGLDRQDQVAGLGTERLGLQPVTMGLEILGRRRDEHLGWSEKGRLLLKDAMELDVTELLPGHGCPRALLGWGRTGAQPGDRPQAVVRDSQLRTGGRRSYNHRPPSRG